MEKYTVIYSPEAMDDLRSIYSYIAFKLKEPDIAKNLSIKYGTTYERSTSSPNVTLLLNGSRGKAWV